MPRWSRGPARATRPRRAEEVLDRAEAGAAERLRLDARAVWDQLRLAAGEGGVIRRHPWLAAAVAGLAGAAGAPLLLRFLAAPGTALRRAGPLLAWLGSHASPGDGKGLR